MMKHNQLIYFAYADFEESRKKLTAAHDIYNRVLALPVSVMPDQTLTYIQYMKFSRRAEGVKKSREIFKKARDDTRISYQVYVAAAFTEYYCSKVNPRFNKAPHKQLSLTQCALVVVA